MAVVTAKIRSNPGVFTSITDKSSSLSATNPISSGGGGGGGSSPVNSGVSSFNGRTGAVVPQSGDYTTTIVTEGDSLYFTNARAQAAISVSGLPLSYAGGVISIAQADVSHAGYLTSSDWSTFNGKLSDAPSDGNTYARLNGAWTSIVTTANSAQGYAANYSAGTPSPTPTAALALAVDTSNGKLWIWFSAAWHDSGITLV